MPVTTVQSVGNLLWGLARLAEHPGDAFIRLLKEKRAGILYDNGRDDNENEQAMTNVLWSLCVFDELDPELAAEVHAEGFCMLALKDLMFVLARKW